MTTDPLSFTDTMGGMLSAIGLGSEAQISYEVLKAQDSTTSSAIIDSLKENEIFVAFAKKAGDAILQRDNEDAQKLANGIDIAIQKGVLEKITPAPYTKIDVYGKTPDQVADKLVAHLGAEFKGGVLVLVGLSGTGKGTTVDILKKKLPNTTTWSNGNVFRSLTLLAATFAEQQGKEVKDVLTPENLASWMGMLTFGKFNGKFDTKINGLGYELLVSEVCNTVLKGPKVGSNIPTVAEVTQGEVVKFASAACKQMGDDGVTVLLEGRAQTVDYIDSPHRFELVMSDAALIGMRRAAQRIAAKSFELLGAATDNEAAAASVTLAMSQLSKE